MPVAILLDPVLSFLAGPPGLATFGSAALVSIGYGLWEWRAAARDRRRMAERRAHGIRVWERLERERSEHIERTLETVRFVPGVPPSVAASPATPDAGADAPRRSAA